jgi:hypothetical protein
MPDTADRPRLGRIAVTAVGAPGGDGLDSIARLLLALAADDQRSALKEVVETSADARNAI